MDDTNFVVRMRRKPLRQLVQDLDAFPKVAENVQEEKQAQGGALTVVVFLTVCWLVYGEIKWYFTPEFVYKFAVDTEHQAHLFLNIDMIVNMPCSSIGADIIDSADKSAAYDSNLIKMNPTKYDLNQEEQYYWDLIKDTQADRMRNPRKSLDDLGFVSSNVFSKLKNLADTKQNEEKKKKKKGQRGDQANPMSELEDVFSMMLGGGGGGNIRIISLNGQVLNMFGGGGEDGGSCRIQTQVPVSKVAGTFHVSPGKTMPMMGGGHAHLNFLGNTRDYNFSHRILQFSFGEHVPGLITPLDATEKISVQDLDIYQYYLQIVPTKVVKSWGAPIDTYQYSLTQQKRTISHDTGSHGMPGINFKYELNSMAVSVHENKPTVTQFLVRLCAIVGGIVATSALFNSVFGAILNVWFSDKTTKNSKVECF